MHVERLGRTARLAATTCWCLAGLLALSFLSWWLVLLTLLLSVLAAPAVLRARHRRSRMRQAALGGPSAAEAAWYELLDASLDREVDVDGDRSVRRMGTALAEAHGFDEQARSRLHLIIAALERGWYAPANDSEPEAGLTEAVRSTLDAMRSLRVTERLWPRSVLFWSRPVERGRSDTGSRH